MGSASGDVLLLQKFQVCARTKKCNIVTVWQQLSQVLLDRSIGEWHHRLENVVQYNDGHIEQ